MNSLLLFLYKQCQIGLKWKIDGHKLTKINFIFQILFFCGFFSSKGKQKLFFI